ncbi:sugar ABC transporter permease [Microbacterium sp. 2FI]|uniref:carbohydrate ABC transporter permease n=1 Tax=Microbacterium sp. 2FI TaxID=2502193 RepID=UPI0010F610CA|nr:sugar ABC transporter permease [Microbacterium sp. 2FI]
MTTTTNIVTQGKRRPGQARPRTRVEPIYYWFLVPTLILFTLAITVPAVIGIFFSFTNSIGLGEWDFVGFRNYVALFSDPLVVQSYLFTFGFSLVTVLAVNIIALLLAVALTSRIRLKTPLRAIFVIPMVISAIVISFVFKFLFSNSLPVLGNISGIAWLQESILANPDWAWLAIVIVTAWQAIPSALLIYIAGILSIPGEVYEAADIDGASKAQQLLRITVPLMFGYIMINVLIGFKGFLSAYDVIKGLTGGGPGTSTYSIAMTVVSGLTTGDYAYQMANATVFFVVTVVIAVVQLSITRGRNAL